MWSAHIPHMVRTYIYTVYGPHTYRIWSAHIPHMVRTHTVYGPHAYRICAGKRALHRRLSSGTTTAQRSEGSARLMSRVAPCYAIRPVGLSPPPPSSAALSQLASMRGGGESENGISSMHKCQQRPVYVAKESCLCGKRDLFKWQKRPVYVAKESCLSGKRDLCMWQKRPVYVAKESCKHTHA